MHRSLKTHKNHWKQLRKFQLLKNSLSLSHNLARCFIMWQITFPSALLNSTSGQIRAPSIGRGRVESGFVSQPSRENSTWTAAAGLLLRPPHSCAICTTLSLHCTVLQWRAAHICLLFMVEKLMLGPIA